MARVALAVGGMVHQGAVSAAGQPGAAGLAAIWPPLSQPPFHTAGRRSRALVLPAARRPPASNSRASILPSDDSGGSSCVSCASCARCARAGRSRDRSADPVLSSVSSFLQCISRGGRGGEHSGGSANGARSVGEKGEKGRKVPGAGNPPPPRLRRTTRQSGIGNRDGRRPGHRGRPRSCHPERP
jgi:hypothetical protein